MTIKYHSITMLPILEANSILLVRKWVKLQWIVIPADFDRKVEYLLPI